MLQRLALYVVDHPWRTLFGYVLFMVVALLAATQAQEDPCLGEDYAEAHCARPPACTAWTLASA